MERLGLTLLLIFHLLTSVSGQECSVAVNQEALKKVERGSSVVTIGCNFSVTACSGTPDIHWFRYLAEAHEDLCTPNCQDSTKFKANPLLTSIPTFYATLEISSLRTNDSGIYICGIAYLNSEATTSKRTGKGTTLVVTGPRRPPNQEGTLLIVATVLLFLYCIALLSICFYQYKRKSKERKHSKSENSLDDHNKSHKRRIFFQAITQELHLKKYARKTPQSENATVDETIYQNN